MLWRPSLRRDTRRRLRVVGEEGAAVGWLRKVRPSPGLEGRSGWAHKPFQAEGTGCAGLEAAAGFVWAEDLRKSTQLHGSEPGSRKEQAGDGRRRTRSVSAETDRSPTPRESRGALQSRLGDSSCRLLLLPLLAVQGLAGTHTQQ